MKVSLNWLKDYIDINLTPDQVSEILTDIGLEVEGMEEVESIKGGLEGVVVGHVKECVKHPNADKLCLTKVDVGGEELLQIVCGAPNVAVGKKVLVATIGTTLYSPEGEGWKIKKGKIRGEFSEGMLCAEDELGLGDDHDGIIELPEEVEVGTLAKDFYEVESDFIYEIGLTPNRSDATNHIGVAKDLAAALKINYEHGGDVKMPSVENFKVDCNDFPIEVVVEDTKACPRYVGVSIKDVKVQESPEWLKTRLSAIGVRPISNIVDITNFVLHELGQPLHAFDLDKISGGKVIVKNLAEGSKFLSLDEVERELHAEDLMICDGDSKGMCIGGVFGGINSGVQDETTNIFLESAHFNAKSIRRTSMRHNLRTDAAKVFEKGSDPNVSLYALKRAAMLIKELGGGTIASEIVDVYPNKIEPVEVTVKYAHVNRLIGVEVPVTDVKTILEALEMKIVAETDITFTVAVPTNKSDVTREADVIEEILRIYGFNKVPISSQVKSAITISQQPNPGEVRNVAGDFLAAKGFNEMMAVSLSESRYYKEILPLLSEEELVYVNNTSNVHLDIMRPSMLFSGLEAILHNQNRRQLNLKLFEFGRTYTKKEDGYKEQSRLSLFLTGQRFSESWLNTDKSEVDFYSLKTFVKDLLAKMGLKAYQETAIKDDIFSFGMRYHRGQQVIVELGKVNSTTLKKIGIKGTVFYADFNWDAILKSLKKHKIEFQELNKFPSIKRDLALDIENTVKFSDIVGIARKLGKSLLKDINLFDVYVNKEKLGENKKSYAVSFLFEDPTKTLKDKEVEKVMDQLKKTLEDKLGAKLR